MMIGYRCSARTKKTMFSIASLLFVILSIANVASGENTLQRTSPAYAVALNAATTLNSSACRRELDVFRDAVDIRKLWALRVLDSSGEPKTGFLYGNNYWLGSRSQCLDNNNRYPFEINRGLLQNASRFRKIEDEFPPYKVNYFVAYFRTNSTLQYHVGLPIEDVVTLALCLPDSCNTDHLRTILEKIFQERTLMIYDLYGADFKLENVRDLKVDDLWFLNGRMILVAVILVITLLLMIAATFYDVYIYQKYIRIKTARDTCENDTLKDGKLNIDITESVIPVSIKRPNILVEVLMCFSVYTNTKAIFRTKLGDNAIRPIHGIRFLGMAWIVMLHTVFYMSDFMDNKPWAVRLAEGIAMQPISSGSFSVDTYFLLSGFLMAYLTFKSLKRNAENGKQVNYRAKAVMFVRAILVRFIRLVPAYMMTIGIVEISTAWYGRTSLFYTDERPHVTCPKYWWRNLLFINNFFGRDEMCLSWSWYLSADMQFYVVGTFLVILSSIHFFTAATILLAIFLSSMVLSGYISYVTGFVPTLEEQFRTLSVMYDPPWMRIGPYIVGIVAAYIFIRLNSKLTLPKAKIIALWIVGSGINILILLCMWNRQISVLSSAFYTAITRSAWAVGIAWIIIACCTNHGGIINSILTFKIWIPLSRLTYCSYLLNPLVIRSIYLLSESPMHVEFIPRLMTFLGYLFSTYICGYAYSLMMEAPYILILKLIMKPRK